MRATSKTSAIGTSPVAAAQIGAARADRASTTRRRARSDSWRGLVISLLIIGTWLVLTIAAVCAPWTQTVAWSALVPVVVATLTFLATGLFIVAHDAMHGSVAPAWPRVNHAIGSLALGVYAFLPYRRFLRAHRAHHRDPVGPTDPDGHAPGTVHPVAWYLRFLRNYLSPVPFVVFAVLFNVCIHVLHIETWRLLTFWIAPLVLSTVQLFVFGTYLPHRPSVTRANDRHRAASLAYPTWLSLITCYHFGYHWEHHAWPHVPWWRLPEARRIASQTLDRERKESAAHEVAPAHSASGASSARYPSPN